MVSPSQPPAASRATPAMQSTRPVSEAVRGFRSFPEDTEAFSRAKLKHEAAEGAAMQEELSRLTALVRPAGRRPRGPGAGARGRGAALELGDLAAGEGRERLALLTAFPGHGPVSGLDVTSRGTVLAATWSGRATLFDVPGWRDLGDVDALSVGASPTRDYEEWDRLHSFSAPLGEGGPQYSAAAFMPSDPQVFALAMPEGVQLWQQGEASTCSSHLEHPGVTSIAFHKAQPMLGSAANDGSIVVWDAEDSGALYKARGSSAALTGIRFIGSDEGFQFAFATTGLDGCARLWDARFEEQALCVQCPQALTCVEYHDGSRQLLVGCTDGLIHRCDARTGRELPSLDGSLFCPGTTDHARSLATSPCERFLAAGCLSGDVRVFDLHRQRGPAWRLAHHADTVGALAWGPAVPWAAAPQFLACASLDGEWSCWGFVGRQAEDEAKG